MVSGFAPALYSSDLPSTSFFAHPLTYRNVCCPRKMESNEIENLFAPTLAMPKSEYGKEDVVIRPLFFDRVNEGFPITSATPFFQLPIELLNDITTYLGAEDLKSLALVDRDCRQLARYHLLVSHPLAVVV